MASLQPPLQSQEGEPVYLKIQAVRDKQLKKIFFLLLLFQTFESLSSLGSKPHI